MRSLIENILVTANGLTLAGCLCYAARLRKHRMKLDGMVHEFTSALDRGRRDRGIAQWATDTKITVCSVTGTWFSMTLAELAKSPVPYRAWNVPVSVEFHPSTMDVTADQEQAKEHRG